MIGSRGTRKQVTSPARSSGVHTRDFDYKGHTHRASPESPQYEIKSDETDHLATQKGSALTKLTA